MKEFIINKNDSGQRIDKFIQKSLPSLPKSMMYKLFRKKDIKVNGKRCDGNYILCENDRLTLYIKEEFTEKKNIEYNKNYILDVVYEDENIIVINKPTGISVHSDNSKTNDTLVDNMISYLISTGAYNPENESSFKPALCNRLDKNTCGLVIGAKNAAALREINEAIRQHNIHKTYICITVNPLTKSSDTITAYHKKDSTNNIVKISDSDIEGYKKIITKYKVITTYKCFQLVEVTLVTGRTHQIRAHLSHIGSPLLGDNKYGNRKINNEFKCLYQCLCAFKLAFSFDDNSVLNYLNKIEIKCDYPEFVSKYIKNADT